MSPRPRLLAAIVAILVMMREARAQALLPGGTGTGAMEDIDCGTDCDEYCSVQAECKAKCCAYDCDLCVGGHCASCVTCDKGVCGEMCATGALDALCSSRCEVKKWLQCSSGFGGCGFHDHNAHFGLAIERLRRLREYGLHQSACINALHTGNLPKSLSQCRQCQSGFDQVKADLSNAAQLTVRSDPHILITPKEALLHLQRCACTAADAYIGGKVTSFSDPSAVDFLLGSERAQHPRESCFWYAWFEGVAGGSAAYTVSSNLGNFETVLDEYDGRGLHLVSCAWAQDSWIGWWEAMPRSESAHIVKRDLLGLERALDEAAGQKYIASAIARGSDAWVASLWRPEAEIRSSVTSRRASSGASADLHAELKAAVERGERLRALAYGQGRWISWFTRDDSGEEGESVYIMTPIRSDFEAFNQRMLDRGYFASASAFGQGIFVGWFDAGGREGRDGRADYVTSGAGLDFALSLDQSLDRELMATTMSWGCLSGREG